MPERREDFAEIYRKFDPAAASAQASRCSQCGMPFCSIHCPLSNNIPDWLKLCAEGRMEEAYEVSSATNNFPEICGRICPQDRLCEGNCVIEKGFESVTIGAVERHITDTAFIEGWVKPLRPRQERAQSVGIIGAGPGGLGGGEMLRAKGYQVHVYDRYDRVGGLMIYGIPASSWRRRSCCAAGSCWRRAASSSTSGRTSACELPFERIAGAARQRC